MLLIESVLHSARPVATAFQAQAECAKCPRVLPLRTSAATLDAEEMVAVLQLTGEDSTALPPPLPALLGAAAVVFQDTSLAVRRMTTDNPTIKASCSGTGRPRRGRASAVGPTKRMPHSIESAHVTGSRILSIRNCAELVQTLTLWELSSPPGGWPAVTKVMHESMDIRDKAALHKLLLLHAVASRLAATQCQCTSGTRCGGPCLRGCSPAAPRNLSSGMSKYSHRVHSSGNATGTVPLPPPLLSLLLPSAAGAGGTRHSMNSSTRSQF